MFAPFLPAKVGEAPSDFEAPGTGQTYFVTISDGGTRQIIRVQAALRQARGQINGAVHMSDRALKYRLGSIRQRAIKSSKQPLNETGSGLSRRPGAGLCCADGGRDRPTRRAAAGCRVPLNSEVTVRRIGGFNFQVALSNVSAGGCNVEMLEAAEVGDGVITRFPQLEPLGSRICWNDGRTTEVEFLTRLHPAVLDLLVSRLPGSDVAAP